VPDCHLPEHRRDPDPRGPAGISKWIIGDPDKMVRERLFSVPLCFQYPGTYGHVGATYLPMTALHDAGALGVVSADPMALRTLLKEPGAMGLRYRCRVHPAVWPAERIWRPARGLYGCQGNA